MRGIKIKDMGEEEGEAWEKKKQGRRRSRGEREVGTRTRRLKIDGGVMEMEMKGGGDAVRRNFS